MLSGLLRSWPTISRRALTYERHKKSDVKEDGEWEIEEVRHERNNEHEEQYNILAQVPTQTIETRGSGYAWSAMAYFGEAAASEIGIAQDDSIKEILCPYTYQNFHNTYQILNASDVLLSIDRIPINIHHSMIDVH